MFSRFLSINPPEPELLFDVKREHKANSDYPEGYPSLHDFSHNNCFATYQQGNLKSPELYYNPWDVSAAPQGIEYTQLATGVFHITKLGVKENFQQADMAADNSSFKGFGSKMGIFISSDKPFIPENRPYVLINDSFGGHTQGWQALNSGMNIWDLTNVPVNSNPEESLRGAYLSFPNSWWNLEEDGTPAITPCDIYVVFFPVLDESNCNGYGEYLVPKFDNAVWTKNSENIVISNNGLTVDTTEAEYYYDIRYVPQPYYEDDYIAVYSPEFLNISCAENRNIIAEPRGVKGETSEIIGTNQSIGRTTGTNAPFYGGVVFKNSYDSVYLQFYFTAKGVFTMLPYNNDRFTVHVSNTTNNYARLMVSETEPFHDKSELQTLICKCKNSLSGSNSMLYKNEVQPPSQKIGLDGIRFATTSESVTDNSFKACLTDAGLATTEARKSIVSYLDGRVLGYEYSDYELLYKDIIMSVVLLKNEITDEDCVDTGSLLFATRDTVNCFSGQLYYLIGFKVRLTPWQIAWALSHLV